jgi:signal recognition particle GTPase
MGNDIARQFAHLPAAEAVAAAHDESLDPLLVDAAGRLAAHASRSEPDAQP